MSELKQALTTGSIALASVAQVEVTTIGENMNNLLNEMFNNEDLDDMKKLQLTLMMAGKAVSILTSALALGVFSEQSEILDEVCSATEPPKELGELMVSIHSVLTLHTHKLLMTNTDQVQKETWAQTMDEAIDACKDKLTELVDSIEM